MKKRNFPRHHHPRKYKSPPWQHWEHEHSFRNWAKASPRKRGLFFLRFAGVFGLMVVLLLGGMGALAFLLSRLFGGGGKIAALVWVGGCGLSLALPLLAGVVAVRVFRGVAAPLADVMSAADAVADGDLNVRVPAPSHGPKEFARLVNSFNEMTAALEHAEQQRRNLTADVAHELRTPLHIIRGNLEGVIDGVYEPTSEHINATLEETRLLARLVTDLQTLSLAEAGQLPMRAEPVNIPDLLADVHTSFNGQAEAKGIELSLKVVDSVKGLEVQGDADRLDQVLGNLVANAIRHTPAGGQIDLETVACREGVRISVRDNGEGIPADDLPHIFDRFWKGDRVRARADKSGSGLGLAIARQLVTLHEGDIAVESKVGQGTTFTIRLP
ncbi:MAG: ATP-binding protein [Chloroflexota bacterium]|nr:ATP-binding protein [Chloroflexota bacterium]